MSNIPQPPPVFIKKVIADAISNHNYDLLRQVEKNEITVDTCRRLKFPPNALKTIEKAVNIAVETWERQQNAD